MQQTALTGSDSARGTGDGEYLSGREFILFHSHRVLPHGSQSIRLMMGFSPIDGVKCQLQSI